MGLGWGKASPAHAYGNGKSIQALVLKPSSGEPNTAGQGGWLSFAPSPPGQGEPAAELGSPEGTAWPEPSPAALPVLLWKDLEHPSQARPWQGSLAALERFQAVSVSQGLTQRSSRSLHSDRPGQGPALILLPAAPQEQDGPGRALSTAHTPWHTWARLRLSDSSAQGEQGEQKPLGQHCHPSVHRSWAEPCCATLGLARPHGSHWSPLPRVGYTQGDLALGW